MSSDNKYTLKWRLVTLLGILLFLIFSAIFILFGQINSDEGWYLYASRLVYEGLKPYQDFAYTQTPFLPYLYGFAQTYLSQSIYLGRITSVLLSAMALFLSLSVARRYAGEKASGITALLWATFTFGIYFHSITKTYSLTTLLLMLVLYVLSSNYNQSLKLTLATIFSVLAFLTRLSAIFFAIPIVFYTLKISNKKIKFIIFFVCLMAASWILILSYPNTDAVKWNLLTHHTSQWGDLTIIDKLLTVLFVRIPSIFHAFPSYFLLILSIIIVGRKKIYAHLYHNSNLSVTIIGLFFFLIPNLGTGGWHIDYLTPLIFMLFPIIGIMFVDVHNSQNIYSRILLRVLFLSTILLGIIRGGFIFIDISGGQLPVEEVRELSTIVGEYTSPGDKLFVLEALSVAIDAQRYTLPGMAMAQFSYYDGDTNEAKTLNLVNDEIISGYIERSLPKLVIITDYDWQILQYSKYLDQFCINLDKHYKLQFITDSFGQFRGKVEVYIRRDNQ